jgi:predicted CXXCH cytochrome family protein
MRGEHLSMGKIFFAFIAIASIIGTVALGQNSTLDRAEIQKMWEASAHSKALGLIVTNEKASADCYACHSAEGFAAKLQGKKVDLANKANFSTVSCAACHELGNSNNPFKLVMDSEVLCNSCHTQQSVLKGKGAAGIDEARSFHSSVPCVSCHMTDHNHLMKVIRPDDPDLSDKRSDTCTKCHPDRKARAAQIQEWQSSYKQNMDALEPDLKTIADALSKNSNALKEEMKKKYNDAKNNISILVKDHSRGAHNRDFTEAIFEQAAKDIRAIKATLK